MAILTGLSDAEADAVPPPKHLWRGASGLTVYTEGDIPAGPAPDVSGYVVDLTVYSGTGPDLQSVVSAAEVGVRIAASLTLTASITIPAGIIVEVPEGVTVTVATGGFDVFTAGGNDCQLIGGGRITGGRYACNTAGFSDCVLAGYGAGRMLRIDGTLLHGAWITGTDHDLSYLDIEAGQSGIAMSGASGCKVHGCYLNDCGDFGAWLTSGCHDNELVGNRCDSNGLELIGITYDCHDNMVSGNIAKNTGDNGISVTGYRNTVIGNECSGNANHGIGIYGERNVVTGNRGKNNGQTTISSGLQFAGITCTPAFGGLARKNTVVGNYFDDDQARPTQYCVVKMSGDAYLEWGVGQSVANANLYRKSGLNVYRATGPGTTGATAPTHTSGAVSDGGVTWTFLGSNVNSTARTYPLWATGVAVSAANAYCYNGAIVYSTTDTGTTGATPPTHLSGSASDGAITWTVYEQCPGNLNAYDNFILACSGSGNIVARPVDDQSSNKQGYSTAGQFRLSEPTRNLSVDWFCGTGTPEGVQSARVGSIFSRQDVTEPGIGLFIKQSGVGDTGWLRPAMQDGGTTAQRPDLAVYGVGVRGYFYFDTTIGKPIFWSGSEWVDATGAAA